MAELEGQNRIDLRLNVRSQLRRLLTKIRIFPEKGSVALFFQTGERRLLYLKDGRVQVWDAYPEAMAKRGKP